MLRILIADDHPLFRTALRQAIVQSLPDAEIGEAEQLDQVHADLEARPDTELVLLDLDMPGSDGLNGLVSLRCRHPAIAVAVVSANEEPGVVRRALAHGAQAYVPKSARLDELRAALGSILRCESWIPERLRAAVEAEIVPEDNALAERLARLTPQQYRVLELVGEGRLNKQIADQLGIQERTIKAHMSAIFERLGVRNRTQAGVLFQRLRLESPSSIDTGSDPA